MSTYDIKKLDLLIENSKKLDEINNLIEESKHLLIQFPDNISLQVGLESLGQMKKSLEMEFATKEDTMVQQAIDLGMLLTACKAYGKKYNLTAKQVVGCLVDLLTNQMW
jgi:hypothetical protein